MLRGTTMLSLTTQKLGDVTVFRCGGRLTANDDDHLQKAFLTQGHMRIAVLDLAEITAVDAAGLGTLLSLRHWAKATGTELKLMNLIPRVAEVLELTKLMPAFEVCSVHDMLDLLCRAAEQSRLAALGASDRSCTPQKPHHSSDDFHLEFLPV